MSGLRNRPQPGGARPSIVDVAHLAGVSVATVSRALRSLPNVSPATRERVLRAAAELDYTASPVAAGLVTGKLRSIGVIAAYAGRWFFAEAVAGIAGALREQGYDVVLHVLPDAGRRRQFFEELPLRRRVDGIIVVALPLLDVELAVLRSLDLPLTCVGEPVDGVHGERVDNVAAARLAVQHLVNLGHRRIAMIGGGVPEREPGQAGVSVPWLRAQGYWQALADAGLQVPRGWQVDGGYTPHGGERAMADLLSHPEGRPTAVFCQSDEMAFGALRALRRSGLRCPEDVSVVGFDDHELSEIFDVTTVAQPVAAQGAAAAQWLLRRLAGGDEGEAVEPLAEHQVRLVLRGSTGALLH